ncbi:hypothetical protein [Lysinibacillus antri]|uniref:Uncharacterized protein n=1 Tax=Lysinibacillus antri TaxID=2498145 RepID=A0A3S0P6R4_9BACI|nr:hypothetical protein [Lysinibacillus antri]RUL54151.1 hypothetical protein EK386_06475 [Lysinibacillus antri]
MKAITTLIEVLSKKYDVHVSISDIGYETVWFEKDDVDEQLVPADVLEALADPIIADSANFTDDQGDYYVVIVIDTGQLEPYEIWMVNGKAIPDFVSGL